MKALNGELRQFNGGVYLVAQSPVSRLVRGERLAAQLTPLDDALSNTITGILNNPLPPPHTVISPYEPCRLNYVTTLAMSRDSYVLSNLSGRNYIDQVVVLFATI